MVVVEFSLTDVPKNWANYYRNKYVLYKEKEEWLSATIMHGRASREKLGVPFASKDDAQRRVRIHQLRRGELDKDGLYASAKPILDGLKAVLRKKAKGGPGFMAYPGAGLIWDDKERYIDYICTQARTTGYTMTTVRVEIPDLGL